MLSAGEILRQRRLELKLTFTQLSGSTKISPKILKDLEKNQFSSLPAFPYLKGMVQNYAKELKLDPEKIVAVFKRDYDRTRPAPTAPPEPISRSSLSLWLEKPVTLFLAGTIFFATLVGWSWWRLYQPPRLIISSPLNGQTAVSPITIAGQTDRDASLSLNDETVNLEADGSFELEYPAEPGLIELRFRAASRRQKMSETLILVTVIK